LFAASSPLYTLRTTESKNKNRNLKIQLPNFGDGGIGDVERVILAGGKKYHQELR